MQDAVNAKTNAVVFFVRFKVDVGCPVVNGIQQHFLDEFDYWRIVNILPGRFFGLGCSLFIKKIQVELIVGERLQGFGTGFGKLGDEWQ